MRKRETISRILRPAAWFAVLLCCCAPAAAQEESGGMPYPGDLGQAIAALLIFLLLLALLGKFAWKPIVNQLRQREEAFAVTLSDAEKKQAHAEELREEYQQRLDRIETESDQILADSRREAAAEREQVLAEARDEARRQIDRARDDIAAARQRARHELEALTAQMAAEIAQQVLRRNLSAEDHKRLIDEAMRQIAREAEEHS
jgi:F-type H+-transporting ATPase subunit b